MWNRHNVHKMFINIYRNPKTRNWFRYETFYNFWAKNNSTWGERDTIFLCWLLLHRQLTTQPTRGARSAQSRLASPSSESQPSSSSDLALNFFSNLSPRFRCVTSPISPGQFLSGIFILTSLNDTSSPHAREHQRSCLHLTNPCAKRKVLSLTKPEGKIYKTKSLCNYIMLFIYI